MEADIPEFAARDCPEGVDWSDDDLFFTYEYDEETSQFDPEGRWNFGCECYEITIRCRVPTAFEKSPDLIEWFVELMYDRYLDCDGHYVPPEKKSYWHYES